MERYHLFLEGSAEHSIDSMSELVDNQKGLSLKRLLDIFHHVSTVHFKPKLFHLFEESIGGCGSNGCILGIENFFFSASDLRS